MNDFRSFPELADALINAMSRPDPLVRIVELVGDWVLDARSFDEAPAMLEASFGAGTQSGIIRPMPHRESVRAVNRRRRLWSLIHTLGTPRRHITVARRLRVCAPRVARTHRAGRARRTATGRTGPPGSSEDGDPEPGEAGPNSHRLEKLETAQMRTPFQPAEMARKMTTMNQNLKPELKTVDPSELPEIMDVPRAAALIGVSVNSIYYMLEHKMIPARRAGKSYRFRKSVLLEWLAGEPLASAGEPLAAVGK